MMAALKWREAAKNIFYVGQIFSSLDEMEQIKNKYEDDNFCQLRKKDVRTLVAAQKRVPKRVAIANPFITALLTIIIVQIWWRIQKKKVAYEKLSHFVKNAPFKFT